MKKALVTFLGFSGSDSAPRELYPLSPPHYVPECALHRVSITLVTTIGTYPEVERTICE